jgi:hypothetical protein
MNAKEETTLRQKINELLQTSWNSASIADSAGSILCIGRPNKRLITISGLSQFKPDVRTGIKKLDRL